MKRVATASALEWTLRTGAFLCFVGHGAFGVLTKAAWVTYFGVVGIGSDTAYRVMPFVGVVDITAGCLVLVGARPIYAVWMLVWAVWTALLRPLSGESGWEAVERAGNYGVPAALLVLTWAPARWRGAFRIARMRELTPRVLTLARRTLSAALVLLVLGHGALGVEGKTGLVQNYASIMSEASAAQLTPILGWFEIGLAVVASLWQPMAFLIFVAAWKLATELLFLTAGAPIWEVVERGGSYTVPLALAIVVTLQASKRTSAES